MRFLRLIIPVGGWCLLIFFLMWLPIGGTPLHPFYSATLLIHAGLFLVLGFLVHHSSVQILPAITVGILGIGAFFVVLVGITAELGQLYLTTRTFSGTDLGLNVGYGLLGLLLANPQSARLLDNRLITGVVLLAIGFTAGFFGPELLQPPELFPAILLRSAGVLMIVLAGYLVVRNRSTFSPFDWGTLLIAGGMLLASNPLPVVVLSGLILLVTGLRLPGLGVDLSPITAMTVLSTVVAFTALWTLHSFQPNNFLAGSPSGWLLLAVSTAGLLYGFRRKVQLRQDNP